MFSLNFVFFCSLIEELCTKEEYYKTSCNFNFGHEGIFNMKQPSPQNVGNDCNNKVSKYYIYIKVYNKKLQGKI